jgi:hypothetical protein
MNEIMNRMHSVKKKDKMLRCFFFVIGWKHDEQRMGPVQEGQAFTELPH